jgi:signal transduction histidine kinase
MVMAVAAMALLAFWDGDREAAAALEDHAQEQATLAAAVGTDLATRLASPELRSSSQGLMSGLRQTERPGLLRIFIQAPGEKLLRTTDGGWVDVPVLSAALSGEASTLRLTREESARLGLPERMALAGLSHVDAGTVGRWGVAVVASAFRERDRERRGRWRLILAVACAGGLVGGFGGLALKKQQRLALTELTRERDERLLKLSKAATTLTLASGFAHELGTPLGVIAGRAEQLEARLAGDERGVRSARVILEQAERIHQVIRGFLNLAQGGRPSLEKVDPERVVRGAVALVEHRFVSAHVRLDVHVPPNLSPLVCDVRLLEHALVNLLLNACDASQAGSTVEVRAEEGSEGLAFVVLDEGCGIAPTDAARVTQPFFTTKPGGTGLGLAVANEIAKSHHGSLRITAGQKQGTRVAIQLPLSHGEAHARA